MAFPNGTISYTTKIDKNASGWYIGPEYFNVPGASPYEMYLDHVPMTAGTTIIGASGGAAWTQVYADPTAAGQFYVDYSTGKVTFHSGNANNATQATYYNLGDDVMAEHINILQDEIYNTQIELGDRPKGIYGSASARFNNIEYTISTKMANASGINGQWITDDTIRSGALSDDIKGAAWADQGRPVLTDIPDHVNDSSAAHAASAISCVAPGATTFSDIQDHVSASGGGTQTDGNPHGMTFISLGVTSDITVPGTLYGMTAVRGGNIFADNIIASGTILADASGIRDMGILGTPMASGFFDKVVALANGYAIGESDGADGNFTSNDGKTVTVKGGIIVSIV